MFEVVSGSGSTSSESIVNISRSGASSISTSPTTTTTTTNEDKLKTRINQLLEANRVYEIRIRDLETSKIMLASDVKTSHSDPFSLVSMQAAAQHNITVSQPDASQMNLQNRKPPSSYCSSARSSAFNEPKGSSVSYPPESRAPSSLQETVGPPDDFKETKLISLPSLTKSGVDPALASSSDPRQESLESTRGQCAKQDAPLTRKSHDRGPTAMESPELLHPDSDKYEEAAYEKVGPQHGMGHAGLTASMSAAGGCMDESRITDFPSWSSAFSHGLGQPPSHNSTSNPPYMAMVHQSFTGTNLNKPDSDLAVEMENISERLNSEPGDSMPVIAIQMHQIAERISKVEHRERDQKTLIKTLMNENHELKKQLKKTTSQTETTGFREQNTRLMQKLKDQHLDEQTTVVKSAGDWVHVERPPKMLNSHDESSHSLVDRVRKLEREKAELLLANGNWRSQWDQMEHSHRLKANELSSRLALAEQEVSTHQAQFTEQTSQFEGRMLEMKRRTEEEENLKEEAQHQQRLSERRCSEMQDQLMGMSNQLSDMARDKQALSAEINVHKAHTASREMPIAGGAGFTNAPYSALEAEIAMLKEQLKVFAEDFEHERMDRTSAQAARDTAKKHVETLARQSHNLSSQVKHLQKQIKDRDDTISWTLQQNETLQRQATDFKKKLAGEWDEKQDLQRRMLTLERQLQQQQQRLLRNPYLTSETSGIYNPAPMHHQPTPPSRPTMSYYVGGQGTTSASPRHRTTAAAMSPEQLPGAWTCTACTYINYPGRTVCESCGLINSPRSHPDHFGSTSHDVYGSEHALLMSRGGDQSQGAMMANGGDLVVDSGH